MSRKLDFEQVYQDPSIIKEQVDVILSSDIIYGVHLAAWVPKVVDRLLKPDGTFYCVNPKNRWVLLFSIPVHKQGSG